MRLYNASIRQLLFKINNEKHYKFDTQTCCNTVSKEYSVRQTNFKRTRRQRSNGWHGHRHRLHKVVLSMFVMIFKT